MSNSPVDIFRDFRFLCYELTLRAQDPIELPEFIGSTLRGGFGHALKQVGCFLPGDICPPCQQPDQCPYNLLFENRNLAQERLPKRFAESPPKLFVIEPPVSYPPRLHPGNQLKFRLILLNHAIELRVYPIVAMRVWGGNGLSYTRGRFELEQIVAVNPLTAEQQQIYSDTDQIVHQDDKALTIGEICDWCETWQIGTLLKLSFVTPARLLGRGYSPQNLDLRIVLKSALERLSIIALLSGWPKAEIDFDTPLDHAGKILTLSRTIKIKDQSRYSKRQHLRMSMGGFLGHLILQGDFTELKPYLKIAELLHVGKNPTFGLGQIRAEAL